MIESLLKLLQFLLSSMAERLVPAEASSSTKTGCCTVLIEAFSATGCFIKLTRSVLPAESISRFAMRGVTAVGNGDRHFLARVLSYAIS